MKNIATRVLLVAFSLVTAFVAPVMLAPIAGAADTICDDKSIDEELRAAAGCPDANGFDKETTVMPGAVRIIEIVISVTGIVAAGILVYGGLTYVLSTGSPDKTRRAQNIIIYALVGVIVAAFAFTIVYFVSNSIWGDAS